MNPNIRTVLSSLTIALKKPDQAMNGDALFSYTHSSYTNTMHDNHDKSYSYNKCASYNEKKKKKKRKAMNMLSSIMGHRGRAKIRVLPTIENNKRIKSAKEMR